MVRVVNGVLVDDNDPRWVRRNERAEQPRSRRMGGVDSFRNAAPHNDGTHHGGPGVSPFDTINEHLLAAGFPRWQVAGSTVEPIVTVAFLLAFVMLGVKGLLLGALLFYFHQRTVQQHEPREGQRRS